MQNIAKDDYLSINVTLPKIEEQKEIALYVDQGILKFNNLINKANSAIELMRERRTALISAAVTGKLDVRDFDIIENVVVD